LFGHEKGSFTGATQRRIGKFEQAQGGTLFLDEIGEMPGHLQAKLLRVLEDYRIERVGAETSIEVNFRLICATNRNLAERIKSGRFRQDLYFRINVFAIELPPLRQIGDDIELIAAHHAKRLCARMGRTPVRLGRDLVAALRRHDFPGNVRELRNIIEHLLITQPGEELTIEGLARLLISSNAVPTQLPLKDAVAQFESEYIQRILRDSAGNMSKAAETLGLDRSYLYRKLRALGLDAPEE
jgi:two-component system nitrogen regulation response regulator NtrX